jgi:sensor histidine kinase regulating citrate/malate metabolism
MKHKTIIPKKVVNKMMMKMISLLLHLKKEESTEKEKEVKMTKNSQLNPLAKEKEEKDMIMTILM